MLVCLLGLASSNLLPQTIPPNPNPPPPGLAVDQGMFLLIVLGIIYGSYRKIITTK